MVDYILVSPALVTLWIPLLEQLLFPLSLFVLFAFSLITYLVDMDGLEFDGLRSGGFVVDLVGHSVRSGGK